MTAQAIRKLNHAPEQVSGDASLLRTFFLGEIAAQLAELNHRLSGQGPSLAEQANVLATLCPSNDDIPVKVKT
jgi:hypothetical protein